MSDQVPRLLTAAAVALALVGPVSPPPPTNGAKP